MRKGNILAASRLNKVKEVNGAGGEGVGREQEGEVAKIQQKKNLSPAAAGGFSSFRR